MSVTDTAIDIRAEHKEESEEKKKNFLRKERSNVSYKRILPLPDKIIPARVKSKLTDGILEIILPKAKPTKIQKKRTVRVQYPFLIFYRQYKRMKWHILSWQSE